MAKKTPVGIDLGTTYSCVGVYRRGRVEIIANEEGNRTTPSYVSFTDKEQFVGEVAKNQGTLNAANTVFDAKRLIGRRFDDPTVQADMKQWPFTVLNVNERPKIQVTYKGETKTFFPEKISAIVLGKMKAMAEDYLGEVVTDAVITVPAYFNNSQRLATKQAAKIAGLNVLRMINEPTAAAIAYKLNLAENEKNVLVFDLGGGTLDVSIICLDHGELDVLSVAGNSHLGGEDFDNRLVDHFAKEFKKKYGKDLKTNKRALRRLRTACERAKRSLSAVTIAFIELDSLVGEQDFYTSITRLCFEKINEDLFNSVLDVIQAALSDANLNKESIDDIVLVGGSSRIPKIQELLQNFFNGKQLNKTINPDEAVAYGATIQAALLHGAETNGIKDFVLRDVIPFSLGCANSHGMMIVQIKRNSKVPAKNTTNWITIEDNQTSMVYQVFEGERLSADNNLLGKFILSGIPAMRIGKAKVDVTFAVDDNGILEVTAVNKETNSSNTLVVQCENSFSVNEISQIVRNAEKFHESDKKKLEVACARKQLFEYCYKSRNTIKDSQLGKKANLVEKEKALNQLDETLKWLNTPASNGKQVDEYQNRLEKLKIVCEPVLSKLK